MTYQECLEIRKNNLHRIETVIEQEGIEYRIKDIVICPVKETIMFLNDYKKNPQSASNRYMASTDCEVWLYSLNINRRTPTLLPL